MKIVWSQLQILLLTITGEYDLDYFKNIQVTMKKREFVFKEL